MRVKFNPLALLLDSSLEGEFDLVQRIIYEVPSHDMTFCPIRTSDLRERNCIFKSWGSGRGVEGGRRARPGTGCAGGRCDIKLGALWGLVFLREISTLLYSCACMGPDRTGFMVVPVWVRTVQR